MTLLSIAKTGLVRLWKLSTTAGDYAPALPIGRHRNQGAEVYLLRPRCCRTQQYFQEHP